MSVLHAWYSAQAAEFHGTSIYRRSDGSEVEVGFVASRANYGEDLRWPDKEYRGVVTEHLRQGKPPIRLYDPEKILILLDILEKSPVVNIGKNLGLSE